MMNESDERWDGLSSREAHCHHEPPKGRWGTIVNLGDLQRYAKWLLFIMGIFALSSSPVSAASCYQRSIKEYYKEYDFVVIAEIINQDKMTRQSAKCKMCSEKIAKIRIMKSIKGGIKSGGYLNIKLRGVVFLPELVDGDKYTLFLEKDETDHMHNLYFCSHLPLR